MINNGKKHQNTKHEQFSDLHDLGEHRIIWMDAFGQMLIFLVLLHFDERYCNLRRIYHFVLGWNQGWSYCLNKYYSIHKSHIEYATNLQNT